MFIWGIIVNKLISLIRMYLKLSAYSVNVGI